LSGQRLCRLNDIPDGTAKGFTVETAAGKLDILVHRGGSIVRGYVNSCPHVGSPLEWAPDRFISLDGFHLLCGTHGALFRPHDGYCVSGPCAGDSLEPVPIRLVDDDVVFGE
jgi:nitrite reductase/ring-hydroxylating ferredoxin subunit